MANDVTQDAGAEAAAHRVREDAAFWTALEAVQERNPRRYLGVDFTEGMSEGWDAALCYGQAEHAAREALLGEVRSKIQLAGDNLARSKMAHHSGGDSAMIFDEYDAETERARHGWWSVDDLRFEAALGTLKGLLARLAERR